MHPHRALNTSKVSELLYIIYLLYFLYLDYFFGLDSGGTSPFAR
jgi:hypothetical protein